MWYVAAVAGIVIAGTLAGVVKSRGTVFFKEGDPVGTFLNSATIKPLSIEQVNFLLARLEREEAPEPMYGAMCYEMMAAPAVAEYICPVCGEKTLYEDYTTAFIEWELPGARRLVESIDEATDFQVSLDETMYCDFCSEFPDEDPHLILRVQGNEGETVNRVSISDLRKLDSFLQGRLYWVTDNDGQEPLKEDAELIRDLLGL